MEVDLTKIAEECIRAISDKVQSLSTLNIIVAGKTGVGKSTLINAVFRETLAETGVGSPVTTHMRKITKKGFPLCVYDTRGFELGKNAQNEVKDEIIATIKEGARSKYVDDQIHCIWYCVNTASNRVEEEEIKFLENLAAENQVTQVPIIIVLTQSFSKTKREEMKNYLLAKNLDVVQVVPVLAMDYEINDEYVAKAFGLDTLISVMTQALPDELQDTLQNVQRASLEEKKKRARAIVAATTAAPFTEGFAPIPFADATLLIPTQVGMIASITAVFGVDISRSILTAFVSSTLGAGGMTIAGRTIASNLMKLVPGAGTIVGGTISGATAGLLTTAFGEAYIKYMEAVYNGEIGTAEIGTEKGKEKMRKLFKREIKERR